MHVFVDSYMSYEAGQRRSVVLAEGVRVKESERGYNTYHLERSSCPYEVTNVLPHGAFSFQRG